MSEWICCEDELPDIDDDVLVYVDSNVKVGRLVIFPDGEYGYFTWVTDGTQVCYPTYWQPLPPLPEVD